MLASLEAVFGSPKIKDVSSRRNRVVIKQLNTAKSAIHTTSHCCSDEHHRTSKMVDPLSLRYIATVFRTKNPSIKTHTIYPSVFSCIDRFGSPEVK